MSKVFRSVNCGTYKAVVSLRSSQTSFPTLKHGNHPFNPEKEVLVITTFQEMDTERNIYQRIETNLGRSPENYIMKPLDSEFQLDPEFGARVYYFAQSTDNANTVSKHKCEHADWFLLPKGPKEPEKEGKDEAREEKSVIGSLPKLHNVEQGSNIAERLLSNFGLKIAYYSKKKIPYFVHKTTKQGQNIDSVFRPGEVGRKMVQSYILDIAQNLRILEEAHFIHNDLKLDNTIYDSRNHRFKLIDLGRCLEVPVSKPLKEQSEWLERKVWPKYKDRRIYLHPWSFGLRTWTQSSANWKAETQFAMKYVIPNLDKFSLCYTFWMTCYSFLYSHLSFNKEDIIEFRNSTLLNFKAEVPPEDLKFVRELQEYKPSEIPTHVKSSKIYGEFWKFMEEHELYTFKPLEEFGIKGNKSIKRKISLKNTENTESKKVLKSPLTFDVVI